MNFLEVDVISVNGGKAVVRNEALDPIEVPVRVGNPRAGQRARLGIRPQYLAPIEDTAHGQLHGSVMLTERLGSETILEVQLRDKTPLIAALTRDAVFPLGTAIDLSFDPQMSHLFAV